ncbi:MAG: hypothetical protein ACLTBA_09885 [Roseburia intestinalis]
MNPVSRMALTFVERFCDKDKWILWFKILVACIPTIVIALPFNDIIEEKFNNYVVVAIASDRIRCDLYSDRELQ